MKENERFIKIQSSNTGASETAFVDLMSLSELILNEQGNNNHIKPNEVEVLCLNAIKEATHKIDLFDSKDIALVSGFQFPDIKIEPCYGVEVKSSISGWTSIGSSIIESTRIPGINSIYMIFCNLKDNPAKFKCRPYGDVLTDIKVTHSPRYSIDMDCVDSVFSYMNITYDAFRKLNDIQKIEKAQIFTRERIRKNGLKEMPWWVKDLEDNKPQGNIRIWNSLSTKEKKKLVAQCMILFPELLNPLPSQTKYNEATLWLCSYYQIVSPNMRDNFSAGGRIQMDAKADVPIYGSAIYGKIRNHIGEIKQNLTNPSPDFDLQLKIYNPLLWQIPSHNRFDCWLDQLSNYDKNIPIREFILNSKDGGE